MEIVVVVIVVVLIGAAILLVRSRRGSTGREGAGQAEVASTAGTRPQPAVAEFNVSGGAAHVRFEVPLAEESIDSVLAGLLVAEAIEVVREKRHTLPLDDVTAVVAYGRRGGDWVEAGRREMDQPGQLPPLVVPDLLPHASRTGFDPLAGLSDLPQQAPGLSAAASEEGLDPIGGELALSAGVEAALRTQGIDPRSASAGDIVVSLMRLTGFQLDAGEGSPATLRGRHGGRTLLVRVIDHDPDGYPELAETDINAFAADVAGSRVDQGILITEKYSPFSVYERERRDPRLRFITRERLQNFIDALTVG